MGKSQHNEDRGRSRSLLSLSGGEQAGDQPVGQLILRPAG